MANFGSKPWTNPCGKSLFLDKKWEFFEVFSLGKIGQEDVFYDILEGKNAFLSYKKKKFKKLKN